MFVRKRGTVSADSTPAWSDADLSGKNPHASADKAKRVEAMFNAIAKSYDLNNRVHSMGQDQYWRKAAVKAAQLKAGEAVLDCACGTGDLSFAFADAQWKWGSPKCGALSIVKDSEEPRHIQVTGLDFTAGMLEVAKEKAKKSENWSWQDVIFIQGDAMAMPFADAAFDVVSIAFGIRNVSDPAKAFGEFHRVLAPGGRLVVLEFSEPKNALLKWAYGFYFKHIMPRTAALIARDTSGAYKYLPRSVQTFLSREGMIKMYEGAGFTQIQVKPLTFGIAVVYVGVK